MHCPYCGKEMERGELVSSHGIHWYKCFGSGERSGERVFLIKPTVKNFFKAFTNGFTVEGYRCPACKKILLSYE